VTFSVYQYANFAAQLLTTTSATTLNTVPVSTQWMVKDIEVCNSTASAATITLTMAGCLLFSGMSVPGNQTLHWTGLRVLAATNTIVATAGTANALSISVDGQTGN
jgi:hypothetical protein